MSVHRFVGSRIRERRLDIGMRQSDVAEAVGISASYLNLIEHNKRRIGGKLLSKLAQVLSVEVSALASGAEATIVDGMRSAAAKSPVPVEVERVEELATRYPGWARLISAQNDRVDVLENQVETLTDRITNDPRLAGALHNLITSITAIRATAGILVSDDKIDSDWQRRFHINLRNDSQRLAEESKSLMAYLDAPGTRSDKGVAVSRLEEAEAFIAANPELHRKLDADPAAVLVDLIAAAGGEALSRDGHIIVQSQLARYARDAAALPFDAFHAAAVACKCDPLVLAKEFEVDLSSVFRRLARLPEAKGFPAMGLATCDGAGVLTTLKSVAGSSLNRRSPSCPLWPLFTAMHQPGRPIRAHVVLPDVSETRFVCYAIADVRPALDYNAPVLLESTMLIKSDLLTVNVPRLPVGTSCHICPRSDCNARREPSIVAAM